MASSTPEDHFNTEVLKLMLQLAWSDGQIDVREEMLEELRVILGPGR